MHWWKLKHHVKEHPLCECSFRIGYIIHHRAGVSSSIRPGGHKRYTMTSRQPSKFTGPKSVPWLGNMNFKISKKSVGTTEL